MKPVLALIVLALSVLLYLEWRDWSPNIPLPAVGPATVAVSSDDSVDSAQTDGDTPLVDDLLLPPPSKEDYASVIERPLFLPDRRPPPDEPDEEPEPEVEDLSDLAGTDLTTVVITPEIVSAWVRSPTQRETVRLRIGDDYEGWTVKTIEPDKLTLERQGETNEVILRDYANAPSPIPPTRMPVPTQRRQQREPSPATGSGARPDTDAAPDNSRNPRDQAARRQAVRRQPAPTQLPGGGRSARSISPSQPPSAQPMAPQRR